MTDRFAPFSGWEIQALARGLNSLQNMVQRSEQRDAIDRLLDELHHEFDVREDLEFSDPAMVRA